VEGSDRERERGREREGKGKRGREQENRRGSLSESSPPDLSIDVSLDRRDGLRKI